MRVRLRANLHLICVFEVEHQSARDSASFGPYPTGPIVSDRQEDLFEELFEATAMIPNTGNVTAAEISQLYAGIPGENIPLRQLRGFSKDILEPIQSVEVAFALTRRDLSIWVTMTQAWLLQDTSFAAWVGASSRDLPLQGTISVSRCVNYSCALTCVT